MKKLLKNEGFTLVELLVATTIFGLIVVGMYTAFSTMQRTTVNQSNLVDVQQNLRVSVEMITRDIKLAAALIPAGTTGVSAGSNATTLNLTTVSSFYTYARVTDDIEIPAGAVSTTDYDFEISSPTSVDHFSAGQTVRVIRPQNGAQPYDADLIVDGVDRTGPTISIRSFANANAVQYKAGDIIARVGAGGVPDPSTVVWDRNGTNLRRNMDNNGAEIMANDVSTLAFEYLLNDGTETSVPLNNELDNIRAIRVTLTTDATQQLDGQVRQRSLSSITYLRN
jgi:type IV pilus assembly protein PilW